MTALLTDPRLTRKLTLHRRIKRLWRRILPRRIPIAFKFALAISLLISAAMAALGIIITNNQETLLRTQIETFGHSLVSQMAESAKEPLLAQDRLALEVLAVNLSADRTILGSMVFGSDNQIVAQAGILPTEPNAPPGMDLASLLTSNANHIIEWQRPNNGRDYGHMVSFIAPVRFQDVRVGHVLLTLSRSEMNRAIAESLEMISTVTLVLIVLAIALSFWVGKRLSRPIHHLLDVSRAIDEQQFDYPYHSRRNDEIGRLLQQFRSIARALDQKIHVENALSRYLPGNVARHVLSHRGSLELGGTHRHGSVIFADMVGFTSLSEKLPPSEVVHLLNTYFSYIGVACDYYHGTIDKYIGDCAMLTFGVPEHDEMHAFNAVACAVMIRNIVDILNAQRREQGEFPVQFRIGINCGDMLAGNMGSPQRMQYTVVGDAVNLASRLCQLASGNEIVISHFVRDDPWVDSQVILHRHVSVIPKGKSQVATTYLIDGLKDTAQQKMDAYIHALFPDKTQAFADLPAANS